MQKIQTQYMHSLYAKGNEEFINVSDLYMDESPVGVTKVQGTQTYGAELPYPEIGVEEPNKAYLKLILDDYAGVNSEMTAINQYEYQRLVLDNPQFREIYETVDAISKVEKRHLEILGEMIILLGGDSRYWSIRKGTPTYWTPQYISYMRSPRDILVQNIRSEEMTIKQYEQHIAYIKDPQIVELLRRIVIDEKLHLEIYKDLYTRYYG
ncbi:MAG: ferritin-like domain-containing protein [Cellulosilyticaceae bacterium]